jgi:hypothetical protein
MALYFLWYGLTFLWHSEFRGTLHSDNFLFMRDYIITEASPEAWSVGPLRLTHGLIISRMFCFVVYSSVLSVAQTVFCQMIRWLMNNEVEGT